MLVRRASKSVAGRRADFEAFPIRIRPKSNPARKPDNRYYRPPQKSSLKVTQAGAISFFLTPALCNIDKVSKVQAIPNSGLTSEMRDSAEAHN